MDAFASIDVGDALWAGLVSIIPGSDLFRAIHEGGKTVYDGYIEAMDALCREYTEKNALYDFAKTVAIDWLLNRGPDLLKEYGLPL